MLHLVPALLILWLQGTMADRPVPPAAVRAVLDGLPSRSAPAERLRAIEAWLGDRASEEVLRQLGAWLQIELSPVPEAGPTGLPADRSARSRSAQLRDERVVGAPLPGGVRFRDGPVR
ncbi:MAG: hypothetical protein ACK41F_06815 [Fimbriimonadaceae bacterium]